jgi:hypothetical protein
MTFRFAAPFLAVLFPVATTLLAGAARAQGPVQIVLSGEIDRPGGARVEFEVEFANEATRGERATASLSMFLAERTSAADLALLLERRCAAAGLRPLNAAAGQAARPVTCLFFDDVLGVSLRLGQGLQGTVTLGEDRPDSVLVLPPVDARSDASFRVTGSVWKAHDRRHGRVEFDLGLSAEASLARTAADLANAAAKSGWAGDLRGDESWLPAHSAGGGQIDGAHFDLRSSGDWRLEIRLAPRTAVR